MKKEKSKSGFFGKFRKAAGDDIVEVREEEEGQKDEILQHMMSLFEGVKKEPGHLTGWDFDRAFDFIEKYPQSGEADILIGQMYATTGPQLKGLSYASAVKVIKRLPGHAGIESIIRGMYKLEPDYIQELRSEVIGELLTIIPDHPLANELTAALAAKNFTYAYDFIVANPDSPYTKTLIKAMFDRDPNIAVLLMMEKLDHPHVASIFEGIYGITDDTMIATMSPNAILFILDVAPDHSKIKDMIGVLVEKNYIKAYDFVSRYPDHAMVDELKKQILARKPELNRLFDK